MAAMDFVDVQAATYSDLAASYHELGSLYSRKLWHQLTEALVAFTADPASDRGDNLISLYEEFVAKAARKLNQLQLARIAVAVARQYYPSLPVVPAEVARGVEFLETFRSSREGGADAAWVLVTAEVASLQLKAGDVGAAKALQEEAAAALGALSDTPPLVPATVHRVAAEVFKVTGPAEEFFSSAMQFLVHTDAASLRPEVAAGWAVDLALAALVGHNVFNFGEIVEHPILAALEGTPHAWLGELLASFQTGDIDRFNGIVGEHAEEYAANAALAAGQTVMKEKLTLLCVMELVSNLPPAQRTLPFSDIAEATRLGLEQVEWLLMRGMSLGLLRGAMDEVAGTVEVTYVKPRVLHSGQVVGLQNKFTAWADKVRTTLVSVEEATGELFV